jgi:hypothetical protein
VSFYGEELLAPRPTRKMEVHPQPARWRTTSLLAARDCLFSILAAALHICRASLQPHSEDAPCCGDRGSFVFSLLSNNVNIMAHRTLILPVSLCACGDTRWRSWWTHCATSRKVAGSIPIGVMGIFHWHNPFSRTVSVQSTQPLTEMSTGSIFCGVKAAGA